MKIEELNIGDFFTYKNQNVRIAEATDDGFIKLRLLTADGGTDGFSDYIRVEKINPILITEKMLKDNGILLVEDYTYRLDLNDEYYLYKIFDHWWLKYDKIVFHKIDYVHELQNFINWAHLPFKIKKVW